MAVIAPEPGSTRTQPRAGGTIAAGSEGPGTGATFVVSLPVQIATRHAVDSEPAFAAPGVRRLAGLRVVVVDDEPDARDVTKAILASEGAEVVTAASAGDALHAISGEGLDALVADIGMPERDGYWLIRALRSLPASDGGAIPGRRTHRLDRAKGSRRAIAAGYNRHLGKPVDPNALVAAVSALATRTKS